ncbi:barrier-to-autointegration factor-like protein [Oreochromis niloticus]|uniref:barrier-to-autointegration factor-like protein n=1 Tax=Oreochromis niloticus TaxID=8128 RepID=UPI000393C7AD|nr:barrier-to-autointegration factor-like protein [Oreochromis niloticus]XP_025753071.1 barrier-to-autointegration factor-like protein [Oreochromis niloticus]XP_025753072.1 barrier-to-autointegration factor-like protein [Oreochromis niloticus]CAI5655068.1 unnamed protein product [Mustela putorius furo]
MAMITQKHRAFVSEPMLEKPVTAVPGIRPTLGRELQKEGITKASGLLSQYLAMGRNPDWDWSEQSAGQRLHPGPAGVDRQHPEAIVCLTFMMIAGGRAGRLRL